MKKVVKEMILKARNEQDLDLAHLAGDLIYKLTTTYNSPSNWRSIGEELAEEFKNDEWIYDTCRLYDYEN